MVRVADAREASQAAAAGIDAIEFLIGSGAPADMSAALDARKAFPRLLRLRYEAARMTLEIAALAATIQAEEIAFRLDAASASGGRNHVHAPNGPGSAPSEPIGPKTVGILAPPEALQAVPRLADQVDALMLEADGANRLIDVAPIATIDAFATACRGAGLAFGLAGGLEAPDVARLLLLAPDVLAFDTSIREGHQANAALDLHALDAIRALVPCDGVNAPRRGARIAKVIDRIFVRDFEVALSIGAYQSEHGKRQRVRFSVVAETLRRAEPPQDMRDVFSYDIIIETIRVLAERGHVPFVETLAEEVAASLLAHAEVAAVEVKVEKLDVVQGAVGIEILRRRDTS